MTWLDLADYVSSRTGLSLKLSRCWVWDDARAISGKWTWCAKFYSHSGEDVIAGRCRLGLDDTAEYAIRFLFGVYNAVSTPRKMLDVIEKNGLPAVLPDGKSCVLPKGGGKGKWFESEAEAGVWRAAACG